MKRRDYGPRRAGLHAVQGVHVRPWAYGVRVINPVVHEGPDAAESDVAADATAVVLHVTALGAALPSDLVAAAHTRTWSLPLLTWLQMALSQATVSSQAVADDPDIQVFRKKLHLLLDHGTFW